MAEMLDKVELPSRGMYNKKYAQPMTIDMIDFECEKQIYGSQTDEALDAVLKRLVKSPEDFDPSELTEEDRNYLLWRVRIHSYGDQYHGYYIDENGDSIRTVVSLEDMKCNVLDPDFKLPEGTLPMCKKTVVVAPLTVGETRKVKAYCKEKADKTGISFRDLTYEAIRARRIKTIDGQEVNSQEAVEFLHSLKGIDLAYIDWLYGKVGDYGYKRYVETEIDGKERRVAISINGEFFRPDFDDISFGE